MRPSRWRLRRLPRTCGVSRGTGHATIGDLRAGNRCVTHDPRQKLLCRTKAEVEVEDRDQRHKHEAVKDQV